MIAAQLRHAVPGRVRLYLSALKGDPDACSRLRSRLAQCPAVLEVQVSAVTGSLLIRHDPVIDFGEIARHARAQRWFELVGEPTRTPREQTARQLSVLDGMLVRASGGSLDFNSMLFLLLLGLALVQLARGQVVGPAMTLLMQALSLLGRK